MSEDGGSPPKARLNRFPMSLDRLSLPKARPAERFGAHLPLATAPRAAAPLSAVARAVDRVVASSEVARSDRPAVPSAPSPVARVVNRTTLRPQAPLHHAAQHALQNAAARAAASNSKSLGLDSAAVRQRMVQRLRLYGIRDETVLGALGTVPRHCFVDAALATQAYEDTSLPIGLNQTISKPSVVGRMLELLRGGVNAKATNSLGRVLEVGTGCGYQAAVLSRLSKSVLSVERLKPLHEKARELLAPVRAEGNANGAATIRLVYGDGMLGHAPNAPYDSIVSAAGGEKLPQAWLDQLAVGGRLVAPLHDVRHGGQVLVVIDRTEAGFERSVHESVHFVPLKSGVD